MFIETLFNLKYQTPIIISPVAVTERLRTPSLEELLDITAAGIRCETKAQEWAGMMDWSPVEALAEVLEREGRKFFENVMTTFRDAGVDTEDPLQMIMMLKRFNPVRFEQAFHPSSFDGGAFQAFCPSQLGRQTLALRDEIVSELRARQTDLRGRRVVCASADGHSYGLMLIDGVYGALGAEVVNGGVDVEPQTLLDLADEEGVETVCVSTHCGQCLTYAQQLMRLAQERGKRYRIAMGGMFTALMPGNKLPVDVRERICETGVLASNDIGEQIAALFS